MTPHLALFSVATQLVLLVALLVGGTVGMRRHFRRHCLFMRVLFGLQIVAIAVFMIRSFGLYSVPFVVAGWTIALIIHHVFGLVMIALFVYINLAWLGAIRPPRRYRQFMRVAFSSWLIALVLGLYVYLRIWRGL
jgi:uncharacterized membrane protein YozB (DUF420 family)